MPPFLYALIAMFVFAIAFGMHFTIEPMSGSASYYNVRVSPGSPAENLYDGDVSKDLRHAGL
jgi:hypothetical protein